MADTIGMADQGPSAVTVSEGPQSLKASNQPVRTEVSYCIPKPLLKEMTQHNESFGDET